MHCFYGPCWVKLFFVKSRRRWRFTLLIALVLKIAWLGFIYINTYIYVYICLLFYTQFWYRCTMCWVKKQDSRQCWLTKHCCSRIGWNACQHSGYNSRAGRIPGVCGFARQYWQTQVHVSTSSVCVRACVYVDGKGEGGGGGGGIVKWIDRMFIKPEIRVKNTKISEIFAKMMMDVIMFKTDIIVTTIECSRFAFVVFIV